MVFPIICGGVEFTPAKKCKRELARLSASFEQQDLRPIAQRVLDEFQRATQMGDLSLSFSPFRPGHIHREPYMQSAKYLVFRSGRKKPLFEVVNDGNNFGFGTCINVMIPNGAPRDANEFLQKFAKEYLKVQQEDIF